MLRTRVIPCLLLRDRGLVKTVKFDQPKYVGDPINAVRIFNEKEVDELVLMDITATVDGRGPDFRLLEDVANEAFMPMAYGGGIRTFEEIRRVLRMGMEKVILNSIAATDRAFVQRVADDVGSQSIVVSIDVRRKPLGSEVYSHSGTRPTGLRPADFAQELQQAGAGEIVLNSIDRDGTMTGYDLNLIREVSSRVTIPVVALGGAGRLEHFAEAVRAGASAVAAGSLFVFHGKHRAVLISYPDKEALDACFRG